MAETKKARAKKAKPKARASNRSKKTRTVAKPRKRSTSKPPRTTPQAVREVVGESAKDAGGAVGNAAGKVGHAASRAKVPLMTGGAALAGAAGGIALGAHQAHRKGGLNGVNSKELAKAARKVGDVGAQVGEIALEVRRARESTNGNGRTHRSPIEVVLQGLTSRG
jgi:hypothetical protein